MVGIATGQAGFNSEVKELNSRIPAEYYQFLDLFGERMPDALPRYGTFNHAIDLKDGTDPFWDPIYALTAVKLNTWREFLDKM
jgi:hypothetical protein